MKKVISFAKKVNSIAASIIFKEVRIALGGFIAPYLSMNDSRI